jgi:hypothetical protein
MPAAGHAQASPYRWCAVLNVGDASYNCGFVTPEQCRATIGGIGGFCRLNPFYAKTVLARPARARR